MNEQWHSDWNPFAGDEALERVGRTTKMHVSTEAAAILATSKRLDKELNNIKDEIQSRSKMMEQHIHTMQAERVRWRSK